MRKIKPIHTIDARGHVMLAVIKDYFGLTSSHMLREIQAMRESLETTLAKKGIKYDQLRTALVPAQDRREIALVFDTTKISSSWYGMDVMKRLIPLLDKKSNHSILVGDYLARGGDLDVLYEAFVDAIDLRQDIEYEHPSQFYIVYINNLSSSMIDNIDNGLKNYQAYAAIADMTYSSVFKTLLSTMLVNLCIKFGSIIIQGHEPDRNSNEDVNMSGYPFEDNGYTCRSVSGDEQGVLLSYKIERAVFKGFEEDTEFSLNSVNPTPLPLDDFNIEVADAKLEYLKSAKSGSLARAGLESISTVELSALIKGKIDASYIYSMAHDDVHGVTKFNIIIEIPGLDGGTPTRLLAALEYKPDTKTLRLITLY